MLYYARAHANSVEENVINYSISNPFYLYAPKYWQNYYTQYLAPALQLFDGSLNVKVGETLCTNQLLLSSIANGITNKVFANGIDFKGDSKSRLKISEWAFDSKVNLVKVLKRGYKYSMAGGSSLLKLNRTMNDPRIFVSSHRIDTFFADTKPNGEVVRVRVFQRVLLSTVGEDTKTYMLVEERKFIDGMPYVIEQVYLGSGSEQTEVANRPVELRDKPLAWTELPTEVRQIIKDEYPSVQVGKPIALPFPHSLGCYLWSWTEDNPRLPESPFGQPMGDMLQSEVVQYDQIKVFQKSEVRLAKGKVAVPSEYINQDDEAQRDDTLDQTVYVSVPMGEQGDIKPIQFQMRSTDIRTQVENIIRDISLKLNISVSSIASFISEGSGSKTATEIMSEKTATDTFIKTQIQLVLPTLNEMLNTVARYLGIVGELSLVFRYENQSSPLETIKIYADALNAGLISPKLFVEKAHPTLSIEEKEQEIEYLKNKLESRDRPFVDLTPSESVINTSRPQDYADVGGNKAKITN